MPFCTNDPNLRNDWLTVGAQTQLHGSHAAQPVTARLLGNDVLLWLDANGQAHASADGHAVTVMCRYGYLWVFTGDTPAPPLFALPEHAQAGRRIVDCGGIGVATSGLRVIENFLDIGHFPYVHTGTLGKVPHTEVAPYTARVDASTGEIWATDCQFYQPRASASAADGINAQYQYRVMQPFTAALYKSCPNRDGEKDVIGLFVQPLDEENVIAHVLLVYFEDVLSDADMIAFQHMIFGQDKPILESHHPRRLPLSGPLEAHMRCDLTAATYRRWLRQRGLRFGVHAEAAA
jgi:phenylpropionate dioxygenase-like ring-hydroxylating dioxygenase large terminal subunit